MRFYDLQKLIRLVEAAEKGELDEKTIREAKAALEREKGILIRRAEKYRAWLDKRTYEI